MITMIVGEVANFAAYAFAPAILVTPLGALSIIISAVLADIMLKEKLHIFGILGCVLCVVGSTTIVLHAPQERAIESVAEVWDLATEPDAHHGLYWCLFTCRISVGHECESSWDSLETDLFRNEPASLSTNMVVHYCCCCMYSNTNELSEQGS